MRRRWFIISNLHKSNEWFLDKVKNYHGNRVEILSEFI